MSKEVKRVEYRHWRVLEDVPKPRSGPPRNGQLLPYMRGEGFEKGSVLHESKRVPNGRGGKTTCLVVFGDGGVMGEAVCSMSDNFVYERGRVVAAADAISKMVFGSDSSRTGKLAKKILSTNHLLDGEGAWLSDYVLRELCVKVPGLYDYVVKLYEEITGNDWKVGQAP